MSKQQYQKVPTETTPIVLGVAAEPRRFHSHFFNCFGNCDAIGWGSCCAVWWCPCIVFGMNVSRTTGKVLAGVIWGLLMFLAYALYVAGKELWKRDPTVTGCDGDYDEDCEFSKASQYYFLMLLAGFVGIITLGIVSRKRMRRQLDIKYDVEGGMAECCDDYCAWFCFPFGLCQETRTLWHNNVRYGEWFGRGYPVVPVEVRSGSAL